MKQLLATLCLLFTSAYSASFVIHTGQTAGGQFLSNPGDVGLIEEGGKIIAGGNGVSVDGVRNLVLNKGLISTSNVGSGLICTITSSNCTAINEGTILIQGDNSMGGLVCNALNTTLINKGLIAIQGSNSFGFFSNANLTNITNSGTVQTLGGSSYAIFSISNNSIITNTGSLLTRGGTAHGMNLGGINVIASNSGSIATFGTNAHGISANLNNSQITNTGSISVNGIGSIGIVNALNNVNIINSGLIQARGLGGLAVFFGGANNTLTLQRGSNLQGGVHSNSRFNLNVETGLNLALSLDATSAGFASLGIDAPFVVVGGTVVVIDPTGLGLQADVLADLSDTILGGVYRHRTGFPCCKNTCERGLWVEGLGSYRDRNRNHDNVGYHNWQGGFILGYDLPAWCGDIDFFGGASFGKAIVDQRTQEADLSNYFAGASYERILCNHFLGAALVAGYSRLSNDRYVMYNLAPGGVQTVHSTPDGFFVAPELTYARQFSCRWFSPILSGTVRYAGLFLGSYNEHGSVANLSVHHRKVQLVTTRAELGLPFGKSACDRCWNAEPYLGVAGRFQVSGKDVDATLLGQNIHFNAGNHQNLGYFLLGFRGKQSLGCLNFFLNVEADFDNHHSSRILGEGGIGVSF